MTVRILGLDKAQSDLILEYMHDVQEKKVDVQVWFMWAPGTGAVWEQLFNSHRCPDMTLIKNIVTIRSPG